MVRSYRIYNYYFYDEVWILHIQVFINKISFYYPVNDCVQYFHLLAVCSLFLRMFHNTSIKMLFWSVPLLFLIFWLCVFHVCFSPFYFVEHLHPHMLAPISQMGFLSGFKHCLDSHWFIMVRIIKTDDLGLVFQLFYWKYLWSLRAPCK